MNSDLSLGKALPGYEATSNGTQSKNKVGRKRLCRDIASIWYSSSNSHVRMNMRWYLHALTEVTISLVKLKRKLAKMLELRCCKQCAYCEQCA